jgi:hypothetical protein
MYAFGLDIPLNVLVTIGLALHLLEFILALAIFKKVRQHTQKVER